jgi:hypothetical protein
MTTHPRITKQCFWSQYDKKMASKLKNDLVAHWFQKMFKRIFNPKCFRRHSRRILQLLVILKNVL